MNALTCGWHLIFLDITETGYCMFVLRTSLPFELYLTSKTLDKCSSTCMNENDWGLIESMSSLPDSIGYILMLIIWFKTFHVAESPWHPYG